MSTFFFFKPLFKKLRDYFQLQRERERERERKKERKKELRQPKNLMKMINFFADRHQGRREKSPNEKSPAEEKSRKSLLHNT